MPRTAITIDLPTALTAIEAIRSKLEWMKEHEANEAPHYSEGEWEDMQTEFQSALDTLNAQL